MNPKCLSINDYDYFLPPERIAHYPLAERSASKLLIYKNGEITQDAFTHLPNHIPSNSLFVFNNSKVIPARILFQKQSGGVIEIFCLEQAEEGIPHERALQQKEKAAWKCLVGGVSKWKHGQVLQKKFKSNGSEVSLEARILEKKSGYFIIGFTWSPADLSLADIFHSTGAMPLPPYIKRMAEESDKQRYQTVYAIPEGSVAAPTAGLHFTEDIMKKISLNGNTIEFVTLHVGAGTFQPVKSETMNDHEMHAEFIHVSRRLIEKILLNETHRVIAVGTTSFRTIETLYWLGVKVSLEPAIEPLHLNLSQWEAYELDERNIPLHHSLQSLLDWMDRHQLDTLVSKTQLLVAPGYHTRLINGLITNFHQPHSTLLLLVAAVVGEDWRRVYDFALKEGFRFLSYGDSSLLWRKD